MKIYLSISSIDLTKQIFRMIRLTFFVLLVLTTSINAKEANSQVSKVSIKVSNSSIKTILEEIEHQTGYLFAFNSKEIDVERKVTINAQNSSVKKLLDEIFNKKRISHQVIGNNILLTRIKPPKQQKESRKVKGTVKDNEGEPLPGATVTVFGQTRGVITDVDGNFEITNIKPVDKLIFSFIGMETQIIDVGNKNNFKISLKSKSEELEDVVVVGFEKQKKQSVVASVTTVKPAELKVPSSNLTTALAGKVSGIIAYQRSGEPGQDNAEFFIRGVTTFGYKTDPLILIDGIELSSNDLAKVHPDDIESFSILKDATATAVYGARGANGVILVNTKQGIRGKAKVSIRFENSISMPTQDIDIADPVTWMQNYNEAVKTRNPLGAQPYSQTKIDNTIAGTNPIAYPAINWRDELLNKTSNNQRLNFNVNGGGKIVRYYLAGSYTNDQGIFKEDTNNNYDSNIKLKKINVRSNINIDLTKSTEVVLRFNLSYDDYTGPIHGGTKLFQMTQKANPVLFPMFYPSSIDPNVNHIMFGNYGEGNYLNPYAEMVKGYKEYSKTTTLTQFEIKQSLDRITQGLSARLMVNTKRYSNFDVTRSTNPYYYTSVYYDAKEDNYNLTNLNPTTAKNYLDFNESTPSLTSSFYMQAVLDYKRRFNEVHDIGGLLVFIRSKSLSNGANSLQKSLPYKNQGLSGSFKYGYKDKYFSEFNFGYNGSERFAKKEKYGFFPSAAVGWNISNEDFWKDRRIKDIINNLKFKASYGLVGNDAIGDSNDRFFYLSQVNLDANGAIFGDELNYSGRGISIDRYANADITWETAKKLNIGVEVGMLEDKLQLQADVFHEDRSNILMDRASITYAMGLSSTVRANVGEAESKGIDVSLNYQQSFNNKLWIQAMGNFTYATGTFKYYEEPNYPDAPWLQHKGQAMKQMWGYIAERLFVDEEEVLNSPVQFGDYGAGDIKYKDINNDGVINMYDRVPIGYPTTPEITYGFGFSAGYKGIDFSCFFQGSARSSFWLDTVASAPFIGDGTTNNVLLQVFADNHWTEANQDIYALWPRLSASRVSNNEKRSTYFMYDGSFLRLKQLEIGYTLPDSFTKRFAVSKCRFYVSGRNLLTFSKFKLWDPEMAGNGLGYPVQKVINFGLQVNF
ncbi:SusC/RagA family TonB-linked outer membrane protein [Prolixibacteraceae bacterium JC049]|nr:SusC/RagA family TonB-linked outer membrane protein [Prolixibacteraceae bacterium JC049]